MALYGNRLVDETEYQRMEATRVALDQAQAAMERVTEPVDRYTIGSELTRLARWFRREGSPREAAILEAIREELVTPTDSPRYEDAEAIVEREAMRTYGPHAVDLLEEMAFEGNWHEHKTSGRLIWTGHAARKGGQPIEDPRETCARLARLARGGQDADV